VRPRPAGTTIAAAMLAATAALAGCSDASSTGASHPAISPSSAPRSGSARSGSPAASTVAAGCPARGGVVVSTAAQLSRALSGAQPGQTIALDPGVYVGDFVASQSGQAGAPITLCGGRGAVLEGESIRHGYVLHLDKASYWRVEGFTVEGGQKGVVTDGVTHDLIEGLYVHGTGDEAIHLRAFSSDNTVSHNVVRDTGLVTQFYGEGIYVGSANKNWCRYTGCQPDRSDGNRIIDNNIADTTAENIDIKEGTTGGLIAGNTLSGAGMVSSAATSWVNVKGNDWTIEDNTGTGSIADGFSVHQVYPGWGLDNVFRDNKAILGSSGFGIYVQSSHLGTVVACDNVASSAGGGLSNIGCSS
jgi:Right handed beta helix region